VLSGLVLVNLLSKIYVLLLFSVLLRTIQYYGILATMKDNHFKDFAIFYLFFALKYFGQ